MESLTCATVLLCVEHSKIVKTRNSCCQKSMYTLHSRKKRRRKRKKGQLLREKISVKCCSNMHNTWNQYGQRSSVVAAEPVMLSSHRQTDTQTCYTLEWDLIPLERYRLILSCCSCSSVLCSHSEANGRVLNRTKKRTSYQPPNQLIKHSYTSTGTIPPANQRLTSRLVS